MFALPFGMDFEFGIASAVQPLSYLSVVYASIMGPVVFHETVHLSTYAGAGIVVAAGLASLWSERHIT